MKEGGKQYLEQALSIHGYVIQGSCQVYFKFLVDYHLHWTQHCNSFIQLSLTKQLKEELYDDAASQEGKYFFHE